MSRGTFLQRLTRGARWAWLAERHTQTLPSDLAETVMSIDSADRYHAKQGRTTARVRFDGPGGPLSVYLKRHDRLPWTARLAALVSPGATTRPRRPSGVISSGRGRWASRCPRSSPLARRSARGDGSAGS